MSLKIKILRFWCYSLDGGNKAFDNWTAAIQKDGLVWESHLRSWRLEMLTSSTLWN